MSRSADQHLTTWGGLEVPRGQRIPVGSLQSYGDAASAAEELRAPRRLMSGEPARVDRHGDTLVLVCAGGALMAEVAAVAARHRLTLPVLPGTPFATVGGAIAADVHGKNHVFMGSIGRHVLSIVLESPSGILTLGPQDELFAATIGGLGHTGVISEAVLAAMPLESMTWIQRGTSSPSISATFEELERRVESARSCDHVVAWISPATGRGVVLTSEPDPTSPWRDLVLPSEMRSPLRLPLLPTLSPLLDQLRRRRDLGVHTVGVEEVWWPPARLDRVWGALHGRAGVRQWQVAVPASSLHVLVDSLERLRSEARPTLMTLKKFAPGDDAGMLSFTESMTWSAAVDLAAVDSHLGLLNELDAAIVAAGGRVYLVKDDRTSSSAVAASYPRLDKWRQIVEMNDPERSLASGMTSRLGLRKPIRRFDRVIVAGGRSQIALATVRALVRAHGPISDLELWSRAGDRPDVSDLADHTTFVEWDAFDEPVDINPVDLVIVAAGSMDDRPGFEPGLGDALAAWCDRFDKAVNSNGSIVILSSVSAANPDPSRPAYSTQKQLLESWSARCASHCWVPRLGHVSSSFAGPQPATALTIDVASCARQLADGIASGAAGVTWLNWQARLAHLALTVAPSLVRKLQKR